MSKAIAAFPAMPACRDGLSSWCGGCHRAAARESYSRNRAKVIERARARHDATREDREKERREREAARIAARVAQMLGSMCERPRKTCIVCGSVFAHPPTQARRTHCSEACRLSTVRVRNRLFRARRPRKVRGDHSCLECGVLFTGTPDRKFCSDAHARRFHQAMARHRLRVAESAAIEPISRTVVFTRDNWTCGICHEPVDRTLSGRHRLGPTIDHIIPLVRGGDHTYANVQLAHSVCNIRKHDLVAA